MVEELPDIIIEFPSKGKITPSFSWGSFYVNVYPPVDDKDLPIIRKFATEKEALQMRLEGCLATFCLLLDPEGK